PVQSSSEGYEGCASRIDTAKMTEKPTGTFGPNAGLVDEMYERFRADPSSVAESWRDFFADYGDGDGKKAEEKEPEAKPEPEGKPKAEEKKPAPKKKVEKKAEPEKDAASAAAEAKEEAQPIRGAAARIVQNMEA